MQILQDNTWPTYLTSYHKDAFSMVSCHTSFYATLLFYSFSTPRYFHITPQPLPRRERHDGINFVVNTPTHAKSAPLFFISAKNNYWADSAELRFRADQEIRKRLSKSLKDCPLPFLWGISFLGSRMHVYCADTATSTVNPPPEPPSGSSTNLPPDFLAVEWDVDVLSEDGFKTMKEIMGSISTQFESLRIEDCMQ
ncbi:hypothetical protein AN958_12064 [Leucoagaricus sp. SymC.cos]|nr:hypothetical protein AN958_12064 [Leucoagaricus sp. SymC.cos]